MLSERAAATMRVRAQLFDRNARNRESKPAKRRKGEKEKPKGYGVDLRARRSSSTSNFKRGAAASNFKLN